MILILWHPPVFLIYSKSFYPGVVPNINFIEGSFFVDTTENRFNQIGIILFIEQKNIHCQTLISSYSKTRYQPIGPLHGIKALVTSICTMLSTEF